MTDLIVNRLELAAQGLDSGPETIRWCPRHRHDPTVSDSTIRRRLIAAGLSSPHTANDPIRPRCASKPPCRTSAGRPARQSAVSTDGTDDEAIVWLDDHSRRALSITSHFHGTGDIAVDTFTQTAVIRGFPAVVLIDDGLVGTTRLAGGRGGRNRLETLVVTFRIDRSPLPPEPPDHLREGRMLPPDHQTPVRRPTGPGYH